MLVTGLETGGEKASKPLKQTKNQTHKTNQNTQPYKKKKSPNTEQTQNPTLNQNKKNSLPQTH